MTVETVDNKIWLVFVPGEFPHWQLKWLERYSDEKIDRIVDVLNNVYGVEWITTNRYSLEIGVADHIMNPNEQYLLLKEALSSSLESILQGSVLFI